MVQTYFSSTIPIAVITLVVIIAIGSLSVYGFRYVSHKHGEKHILIYVSTFPIFLMWMFLLLHLFQSVWLFTTNSRVYEIVSGIIGFIYVYGSWFYIEQIEFDKKTKLEETKKASDQ